MVVALQSPFSPCRGPGRALVARRPQEPASSPTSPPAVQEAASRASQAMADLQRPTRSRGRSTPRRPRPRSTSARRRSRRLGRADRRGPGEDRGRRSPTRRDRPADPHPDRADGPDGRQPQLETAGLKKALRQTADARPVGRAAAAPLHRDRRDDRARRLRAAGDAAHRRGPAAPRRPLPAAGGPQLRRRLEGAARRLPRRPGGREVESRARGSHLERHARQAREHVRALSSKDYQGQFKPGEMPDLVVCFIPNEPALHAAFAADPTLFDYALERNVLLVSPTSLIGLLRTMELGWRQERMVAEAAEIADAAGTLHAPLLQVHHRLRRRRQTPRLGAPSPTTRRSARWRARLLPQLRKVEELGIAPGKEIEPPRAGRDRRARDHRAGAARRRVATPPDAAADPRSELGFAARPRTDPAEEPWPSIPAKSRS